MSNPTVVSDPYAGADLCDIVQRIVDNDNVAITGQARMHSWTPSVFKRDRSTKNLDIGSLERSRIILPDTSITS
jgi:hypothetical protein